MNFLVIDDHRPFREAALSLIQSEGHSADGAASGDEGLEMFSRKSYDAVFLDLNLGQQNGLEILKEITAEHPHFPVIMCTAEGGIKDAVEAIRLGALDFLEKPFTPELFKNVCLRIERINQMGQKIKSLEREIVEQKSLVPDLVLDFSNPQMQQAIDIIRRSAVSQASVLILGESGTGKSVLARMVHTLSRVHEKPFITVSCPSLSRELLESELFGYVRGAFTGAAKDHWGKVKAAEGGTLFLDEIGDLPLEIQPKLLRLLQEREYERVGENITRKAEIRVVTATNQNLKNRVKEGLFREDLYFRLNVITVQMPPLRERPEDLLRFSEHYLQHFCSQCGKKGIQFSDEARSILSQYEWPGNLRELRNAIERAVILSQEQKIASTDLPMEILETMNEPGNSDPLEYQPGDPVSLSKLEEIHIRKVLASTDSLSRAAEILGIDQTTLYRKRKRLMIEESESTQ